MKTGDEIWIPSYYRRRRLFPWGRTAGGPRVADWVVGVVCAALALGFVALRLTPRDWASLLSTAVTAITAPAATAPAATTPKDGDVSPGRVAYTPQASVDK